MIKGKVLEVFRSIQGEGKYAGLDQVFVRLFECNMHCVWCDTPHSIGDERREYEELNPEELFKRVRGLGEDCRSATITGGEPLLQVDFLKQFIPYLRKAGMSVHLETNGTLPKELEAVLDLVDVVAMDIKLPSSTRCRSFWDEHEDFLKAASRKDVFIKTVVTSDTKKEDIEAAVDIVSKISPATLFILQPNYFEMKNGVVKRCLEFHNYCSKYLKDVRILPQMHKFMKLR